MKKQPLTIITIEKGDEYRSRVADIYEENAFFYPAYLQAGQCVVEILEASERFSDQFNPRKQPYRAVSSSEYIEYQQWNQPTYFHTCQTENSDRTLSKFAALASYPNNIIAFCGERGGGKTSAMVSFAKALEYFPQKMGPNSNNLKAKAFWDACKMPRNTCEHYRFMVLDPIDPTLMEQADSILWIILSRLFDKFQEFCKIRHPQYLQEDSRIKPLIGQFQDCFKALDTLKSVSKKEELYFDDLSHLVDLNDSSQLKQKLEQLVRELCAFVSEKNERWFLILQIDDADLNSSHAYAIMEDLRKYMLLPNVIILMSMELRQLELVVEQHFVEEFKSFISVSQTLGYAAATDDHVRCHSSAERYIDKFLPGQHQIHLPNVDKMLGEDWTNIGLSYLYPDGTDRIKPLNFQNGPTADYQRGLLLLLYRKTRIILIGSQHKRHCFLPATMRMLTHFLALLGDLKDIPQKYTFEQLYLFTKKEEKPDIHNGDEIEGNPASVSQENPDDESTSNSQMAEAVTREDPMEAPVTDELLLRARQDCIDNLDRIDGYFRHVWCHMNLTARQLLEIEKLFNVPLSELHLHCQHVIQALLPNKPNKKNNNTAPSFEDVFDALQQLGVSLSDNQHNVKFAIEFYYTLAMHRWLITQTREGKKKQLEPIAWHITVSGKKLKLAPAWQRYIFAFGKLPPAGSPLKKNRYYKACCYKTVQNKFVYDIVRLMCSDTDLRSTTSLVDATKETSVVLSPVQFMISMDIQNLFLETLTNTDDSKPVPDFKNFLIHLNKEFDDKLKEHGSPLTWGKNRFDISNTSEIDAFDEWLTKR